MGIAYFFFDNARFSAMRALTSFFTSSDGRGLLAWKWMEPLPISKSLSSSLKVPMRKMLRSYINNTTQSSSAVNMLS